MPLRFYRVTQSNPPTVEDFKSQKEKGIPMARPDPEVALIWDGVSVYATEPQARRQAKAKPWIGSYIAEVAVSDGDPITFRRTGTGNGHHTLWGDPHEMLSRVLRVLNV